MSGFFGTREHKAAKSPATTVPSSSIRPQQNRRHSDQVKSGSSPRPSILASKTWHTSSTGEPSPKLPKSPRQKRVKEFFRISRSPDDEDDEGYEFKCRGIDEEILVVDKSLSSRENASPRPAPHRVSTSSRSSSQDLPASRRTFAPPTIPKSPYQTVSKNSHTNPRPRKDVCDPKDRTEDSGAVSNREEYRRGRDGSKSRRNRERDSKVQSPDDGISLSSRDHNDEKRAHSRYRNDYDNASNYKTSSNQHKSSSGRRENHKSSDPKAAGNRDKNGHVARVAPNGRKPDSYEVHLYTEDLGPLKSGRGGYKRENLV